MNERSSTMTSVVLSSKKASADDETELENTHRTKQKRKGNNRKRTEAEQEKRQEKAREDKKEEKGERSERKR